jgi:hypothetical protein
VVDDSANTDHHQDVKLSLCKDKHDSTRLILPNKAGSAFLVTNRPDSELSLGATHERIEYLLEMQKTSPST